MATTNLQTATSAAPRVLVAQYVPITGAAQYQADIGTTADLVSVTLHNTDTVSRTVTFSVVMAGGTASGGNRRLETVTMTTKQTIDLGQMMLGDGDFIWAQAGTASTIALTVTGIEFSNATGSVIAGIQDDAIGSGGRTSGTSTVTGTNAIGTASGRRLYAALMVTHHTSSVGFASYDTLTMSCTAGAMTRLISCNFDQGGNLNGSVHIFERINPTSASTQALTATMAEAGLTVDLTLASISLSGIASVAGATSSGPSSAAALSLPVSSAAGNRALFAAIFQDPAMDFNQRVRASNGNPAVGAAVPHWMLFADALGAATVTATTSNSQLHCGVGLSLVKA